jgi:hypothetical protein
MQTAASHSKTDCGKSDEVCSRRAANQTKKSMPYSSFCGALFGRSNRPIEHC